MTWIVASLVSLIMSLGPASTGVAQSADLTVERDIPFASPGEIQLYVDAYLPATEQLHPAVMVIPGGRWGEGSREDVPWLPPALANLGFATFVVDYRDATQAPFPAAFEDVQAAVRFLRENSARFDIDPARIGAVGAFAGGHLAALLATAGEGPTDSGARVSVAISWSGPMDLVGLLDSDRTDLVQMVLTLLGCSDATTCREEALAASPIEHVDPTDGAIYVGNSTQEIVPVEQARLMDAALTAAGVQHQLVETVGSSHGFAAVQNAEFFTPAANFLGDALDNGQATQPSPNPGDMDESGTKTESPLGRQGGSASPRTEDTLIPGWVIVVTVASLLIAATSLGLTLSIAGRLRHVSPRQRRADIKQEPPHQEQELVGTRIDHQDGPG